jgi:DNA-binding NarL/FixJ family response regulator
MLKIMIVESVPALRKHLRLFLIREFSGEVQFSEAEDPTGVAVLLDSYNPDCIIIGGGVNAGAVAAQIRQSHPQTCVVFWARAHDPYKLRQVINGNSHNEAFAYVLQTSPDTVLLTAIESLVNQRQGYVDPAVRQLPSNRYTGRTLTEAEYITLGDMLLGLTDKAIAQKRHVSVRGVQHRITCIAAKLGVKGNLGNVDDGVQNLRVRIAVEALRRAVFSIEDLKLLEDDHQEWLRAVHSPQPEIVVNADADHYPISAAKLSSEPVGKAYI